MNSQSLHSAARIAAAAILALGIACTDSGPTESSDLSARFGKGTTTTSGPSVNSTSPNTSPRGTTLDVHVFGSGFDSGSKAQWALKGVPSPKVTTNSTRFVSSRELVANITIASDADPALYDVIVTTASGKPGIGTESFEVTIEMTDLGNLGYPRSEALAVNDVGQIVGISNLTQSTWSSFLWENGVMKDIGMPAGFSSSRPQDINNLGQVAGYAMVQVNGAWVSRAFSWTSSGGYQLLPALNGSTSNQAMGINDNGMIVGSSGGHAVAWINGSIVDLGANAVAYDVNANGDVAADCSNGSSQWQACRWTASTGMQFVQTMNGTQGEALGINDDGFIVGWGGINGSTANYAYVNRNGAPENLGITGGENSVGIKISIHGQIAGRAGSGRPALWYADGSMIFLNSSRATSRGEAVAVNANGWVVGFLDLPGKRGSERHAVRWRVF